ncbi:MAG TPA: CocE/NonD family hydrolase [Flavitalea sp.]|nr:CocE/NonD family hydrolase [Flavitalea sp.]
MRKFIVFVLFVIAAVPAFSQGSQDSAWFFENYTKKEMYIPMRDGVKLFTSILIPKDASEKHPIIFNRTPYSCAPYGEEHIAAYWNSYYRYYLREGYIIVKQDVRGRWMSEGEFVDIRPFNPNKKTNKDVDEASDTYDAIDWIVKNIPNNNGNVGVSGISYPGFYSTMAALSGHPALKAVSPQAPVTEWFMGDDFHHNGAFFQMDGFAFYTGFGQPRPAPTTVGPKPYQFPTPDAYDFYLRTGPLKNLTKIMGDSIKFWQDLMSHPNYDTFWKARNPMNYVTDVKPVMLTVGGLFDAEDCFGAWNLYKAIEKKSPGTNNRIVMGPWYHGQWASVNGSYLGNVQFESNTSVWYQNNIEIPFFNYYLKGKGEEPKLAEATIFFSGENKWRKLPSWPMAEKKDVPIYLQPNGKLAWSKPAGKTSFTEYISDPAKPVPYVENVGEHRTREYMTDDQRFAAHRPDVLVFQTEVLNEDMTLAGPVIADLLTSITGTDADFVVKIIDVFPDDFKYQTPTPDPVNTQITMGGYQMLVRGEIMRGRFRNSFEQPSPFKPNSVERVKFTLPDIAHTFKKGHKLMIQIQSSWFPLVDRNPQKFVNIYTANENDFQKATIRIFHDGTNSSNIVLPVVK